MDTGHVNEIVAPPMIGHYLWFYPAPTLIKFSSKDNNEGLFVLDFFFRGLFVVEFDWIDFDEINCSKIN